MARRGWGAKYRPRRLFVLGAVATVAALGFIGLWGLVVADSGRETR
jgi:hypothetical protein